MHHCRRCVVLPQVSSSFYLPPRHTQGVLPTPIRHSSVIAPSSFGWRSGCDGIGELLDTVGEVCQCRHACMAGAVLCWNARYSRLLPLYPCTHFALPFLLTLCAFRFTLLCLFVCLFVCLYFCASYLAYVQYLCRDWCVSLGVYHLLHKLLYDGSCMLVGVTC